MVLQWVAPNSPSSSLGISHKYVVVAQLVERRSEEPQVIGSTPIDDTSKAQYFVKEARDSVKVFPAGSLGALPRCVTKWASSVVVNTPPCHGGSTSSILV